MTKKAIFLAVFGLCSLSCPGQEGNVFQHFSLSMLGIKAIAAVENNR